MKFKLIIDQSKPEEVVATVHEPSPLTDRLEQLLREYTGSDRVMGFAEDDMKALKFTEIQCITVENGKTYAITAGNRRYRLKQRLYELEAMLPSCFIRVNKSALVNENKLERFIPTISGAVDVQLQCGYREYVSRRCFTQIKRRYDLK